MVFFNKLKLFTFFVSFCFSLSAQTGMHLGGKIFVGSSSILFQHSSEIMKLTEEPSLYQGELGYNLKFAFFLGGSILYNFERDLGIQADILYFYGGQSYGDVFCEQYCAARYEVKKSVQLSQVQIPIMLKKTFGTSRYQKFYLMGGPSFNYTFSGSESGEVKIILNSDNSLLKTNLYENPNIFNKIKEFDLGLAVEAGFNFYFTKKFYASLGANAALSLLDINSSNVRVAEELLGKNYIASRFARFGITASLNYVIFGKDRNLLWRKGGF